MPFDVENDAQADVWQLKTRCTRCRRDVRACVAQKVGAKKKETDRRISPFLSHLLCPLCVSKRE